MSYTGYSQGYPQANSLVSNEIRQEIQRFESVHPSIYAIYDLIEGIADISLQNQIRDHVVSIEGKSSLGSWLALRLSGNDKFAGRSEIG